MPFSRFAVCSNCCGTTCGVACSGCNSVNFLSPTGILVDDRGSYNLLWTGIGSTWETPVISFISEVLTGDSITSCDTPTGLVPYQYRVSCNPSGLTMSLLTGDVVCTSKCPGPPPSPWTPYYKPNQTQPSTNWGENLISLDNCPRISGTVVFGSILPAVCTSPDQTVGGLPSPSYSANFEIGDDPDCAPCCFGKCGDICIDWPDATITDDNGTWIYDPGGRFQPDAPELSLFPVKHVGNTATVGVLYPENNCGVVPFVNSGNAAYAYAILCDKLADSGLIGLRMNVPQNGCTLVNNFYNYYYSPGIAFQGTPIVSTPTVYVVPDSFNPIVATFPIIQPTVPPLFLPGITILSNTATITLPYERRDPNNCCQPCPIPTKDLIITLCIDGNGCQSYPISRQLDGNWTNSDGIFIWGHEVSDQWFFACDTIANYVYLYGQGTIASGIQGTCFFSPLNPFGGDYFLVDYTCKPFHMHFQSKLIEDINLSCFVLQGETFISDVFIDEP